MPRHRHRRLAPILALAGAAGAATLLGGGTAGPGAGPGADGSRPSVVPGADIRAMGSTSNHASDKCQGVQNASCEGRLTVLSVGVDADLLYPSRSVPLPVVVGNPNNYPVTVVTVALTSVAGTARCPASTHLVWSPAARSTEVTIPAKAARTVLTRPLTMAASAAEACKRVSFPVTVTVTAVR